MPANPYKKPETSLGLGTKVDPKILDAAVDAYLEQEATGTVSKSEIGRFLGLERAPEWLDSPYFLRKLDVARFTKEVSRLRGNKELVGLLDHILDAALVESMNRLLLDPASIPSSVLFGESLIKLMRLRSEMAGSGGPISPKEIWINIHQEITNVQDPKIRQKLQDSILGQLSEGAKLLEAKNDETVDAVDVVTVQLPTEPVSQPTPPATVDNKSADGHFLWNDPALD